MNYSIAKGWSPWIFISLFVVGITAVNAQNLYVCKIHGTVFQNHTALKVGDELKPADNGSLEFSSNQDFVIVISPEKGRCKISPESAATQTADHHLWVFVKNNLVPCAKMNSLYTRSSGDVVDIKDFIQDGRMVMLDSITIPLSDSYLADYRTHSFIVKYEVDGRVINKSQKINPDYPYIVINSETFRIGQHIVDPATVTNLELLMHDGSLDQNLKVSDLKIVSLVSPSVNAELRTAYWGLMEYCHNDINQVEKEMKTHIEEFYGRVDDKSLKRYVRMLDAK